MYARIDPPVHEYGVFENSEKKKNGKYAAFASQQGASFLPLVMEASGIWPHIAQVYIAKVVLRYTTRKGMISTVAKTYW